jgi:hypothetical protein
MREEIDMGTVHRALALGSALACMLLTAPAAQAQADATPTGAGDLIVVLRESVGENKQDEVLQPIGRIEGTMADGRRIELETSWYRYLGDMHIRLVFDGGQSLQSASPADLSRLKLSPEEALRLAVANLRRVYGEPAVRPWSGGLMQVQAAEPDFTSSYFLDREFWQGLQAQSPEGLVVAVPRRGGLVYAPVTDADAIASLRFSAAALYAGGAGARLSSALYLFKDGRWSVYQAPQAPSE